MKIHFDLTHPKQSLFFPPLMDALRERGASISITTREFGRYGTSIIDLLNSKKVPEKPVIIGRHSDNRLGKLQMFSRRVSGIGEILEQNDVDGLVCLSSPSGARAAFGLGKKLFCFNDIPEAYHTAMLTIPFADHVFHPFCIPEWDWKKFVGDDAKKPMFYSYPALDPIVWLKDTIIDEDIAKKMGIDVPYILVKHTPTTAAFLLGLDYDPIPEVVNYLTKLGIKVLVHSYDTGLAKQVMPDATILEGFVDLQSLIYNANVLLTGGGTTSIEAGYYDVPVVSMRPILTRYDLFLLQTGFMRHTRNAKEAIGYVLEDFDSNKLLIETNMLQEMEFPINHIADVIINEIEK